MKLSLFSHLFTVERHRQQYGESSPSLPVMMEAQLEEYYEPLLVSNMQGRFLVSRPSKTGLARYAFFECPLDEEANVFSVLLDEIKTRWGSEDTLDKAVARVEEAGLVPKLVVSHEEVEKPEGLIGVVDSDLPRGTLAVISKGAGVYTRVGNYVGVLLNRADVSVVGVDSC